MTHNIKKYRKVILISAATLFAAAIVCGSFYLYRVSRYKATIESIVSSDIDITSIPDGIYTGEFDAYLVGAKVQVTVENGTLTDITLLEHKQERGSRAESIVKDMVEKQQIDVDAVSGATNSSKVIKKAVENALTQ